MLQRIGLLIVGVIWLVASCDSIGVQGGARDMLPDLPNTNVIEGQTISEYIATLAEGASLLQANPLLALAIEITDNAVTCYQDIGAVALRIYSDVESPLSSGAVAIVDRNALLDAGNLVRCVTGDVQENMAQVVTVQPCFHIYVLTQDDNEFHIVYVGTTMEMCDALCNSLQGCPLSRE